MDNFIKYIFKSVRNMAYLGHLLGIGTGRDPAPAAPQAGGPLDPRDPPLASFRGLGMKYITNKTPNPFSQVVTPTPTPWGPFFAIRNVPTAWDS